MLQIKPTKRFSVIESAREFYQSEGYYVYRNFLSPQQVQNLIGEVEEWNLETKTQQTTSVDVAIRPIPLFE